MRRLRRRDPRRALSAQQLLRSVGVVFGVALLVACGGMPGEQQATTFDRIGDSARAAAATAEPSEGPRVDCGDYTPADCDQAVMAIVHGLPYGDDVVAIELGPPDEDLVITPEPAWSASARALMNDGFVFDLVIVQEVRPGPMEINFAPD